MTRVGFLFPGQGSQTVGMGFEVAKRYPFARELFRRADELLGFSLSQMCFQGPEEELKKTENAQPALFVVSAALFEALRAEGVVPAAVAGHSLGEYSALYAAGVFDFSTGLRLVQQRGEAFAAAGRERNGAMAAIVGLMEEEVEAICAEVSGDKVVVSANVNSPGQIVISGDTEAVEAACLKAKEEGAKRTFPLTVSGAFHSPLVASAAQVIQKALAPLPFASPQSLFVNNVDAELLFEGDVIKDSLVRQITGTVRWVACMEKLVSEGVDTFVEVGSGKALTGLVRRINRSIPRYMTQTNESFDKAIANLKSDRNVPAL